MKALTKKQATVMVKHIRYQSAIFLHEADQFKKRAAGLNRLALRIEKEFRKP